MIVNWALETFVEHVKSWAGRSKTVDARVTVSSSPPLLQKIFVWHLVCHWHIPDFQMIGLIVFLTFAYGLKYIVYLKVIGVTILELCSCYHSAWQNPTECSMDWIHEPEIDNYKYNNNHIIVWLLLQHKIS